MKQAALRPACIDKKYQRISRIEKKDEICNGAEGEWVGRMGDRPDVGLAHEAGVLAWGMWLCDCRACRDLCRASPDTLVVIKGSHERKIVTAGMIADANPEELIEVGYVREVFVAPAQPDQDWRPHE